MKKENLFFIPDEEEQLLTPSQQNEEKGVFLQ